MRSDRAALLFLAVASPAVLATFWVAGPVGEIVFALLATAFPVALIALGAARRGRLGPLRLPLLVLTLILEGSVVAMLAVRGRVLELPWVAGLPLAAAIQLYGMWLAPLALVALAYALTFDGFTLRREDLERLRRSIGSSGGDPETEPSQDED